MSIEELQFDGTETLSVGLPPVITLGAEVVDVDGGQTIGLGISAGIADGNGEVGSVTITGIPTGSVLSDGSGTELYAASNQTGTLVVTPAQLTGLNIIPPENHELAFNLAVTATRGGGDDKFAFTSDASTLLVSVDPVASAPDLSVTDAQFTDGQIFTFDIASETTDASERLSLIEVKNLPEGSKLSVDFQGTGNFFPITITDGVASFSPTLGTKIQVELPTGHDEDLDLLVASTSVESNGDTATTENTVRVDVSGDDNLSGTAGDDALIAGDGNDAVNGNAGNDDIFGGAGDDVISGGVGSDVLNGDEGSDILNGDDGADTLNGGAGSDVLNGGDGSDTLNGGVGIDELFGGADADFLNGGDGADILTGGAGADTLSGGAGADSFIFDAESGADIISDLMAEDTLVFDGQEFHAEDMIFSENDDGDLEIAFDNGTDTKVTVEGVKYSDVDKDGDGRASEGDGYSVTEDSGQVVVNIDPSTTT